MEYGLWNFHSGFWPGGNTSATPPEGISRSFYNTVNNGIPTTTFHVPAPTGDGPSNFVAAAPCRQTFRPQADFGMLKGALPLGRDAGVMHLHHDDRAQMMPMAADMMAEHSSMESVTSAAGEPMLDPHNSNMSSSHDSSEGARKARPRGKRSPPPRDGAPWDGREDTTNGAVVKTESSNGQVVSPLDYISQQSYQHPMYGMIVGRLAGGKREAVPPSDDTDDEEDDGEVLGAVQQARGVAGVPLPQQIHDRSPNGAEDSPSCSNSAGLSGLSAGQPRSGYECGECGLVADTRPGLKKHIAVCHPAPNADPDLTTALLRKMSATVVCPMASCRFRTTERHEMEAHVARHVAEGYSPNGKKRSGPVSLQRVRYEREEYRCQMCAYSCTIEKAFYKHLKVHSLGLQGSQVKISCVICGKDRSSEVDMNKHMRKHRDERYFCCDICIFKTVQLKKLIQHRRMHTGEKPHLCPHCSYRSARRDNLRSHVRRVHKKDNLFCDTFSPRGLLVGSNVAPASPTPSQPSQSHTP